MNRRSVLKFLGLSSAAAPALAKAGVDTTVVNSSFRGSFPMEYSDVDETMAEIAREAWEPPRIRSYNDYRRYVPKGLDPLELAKRIYRAEQEKKVYLSEANIERRRMEKRRELNRLDPDLAAYKSFSAVTLVRMQLERDMARDEVHTASYWDDVIDHLKKGWMNLDDVDAAMGKPKGKAKPRVGVLRG